MESPYSSHFQGRVPSELRLQGCRCPPGEISVLQPRGLWRWTPECPGELWGSWPRGLPHPPEGSQVAVVPWPGSTEPALLGLLPGSCGATGHPDQEASPPHGPRPRVPWQLEGKPKSLSTSSGMMGTRWLRVGFCILSQPFIFFCCCRFKREGEFKNPNRFLKDVSVLKGRIYLKLFQIRDH